MRPKRALLASGCLLIAALAAVQCSPAPFGTLRLGLYANDLLIPDETNLMALYMAESDASGRVTKVHAFEAAPLREGDKVYVPFPASLVVVSGEVTQRVHLKLIAYHVEADGTRRPLTMREARVPVPTEQARLLRLNLFWHGIGNVVDEGTGLVAAEGSTGVSTERFDLLRSICAGGRAADGQTAGVDGSCVDLDVETEGDDLAAPLPGSTSEDPCLNVAATFAGATVVADLATRNQLAAGACSVHIPATVAASSFNVGVRSGAELRPLPLGLGVRREGERLVLPSVVCTALAGGAELVFAPSADPWTGAFGICAPWNTATRATTEGSATRDGGAPPDATTPDGNPADTGTDGATDADADGSVSEATASRYLFSTSVDFETLDGIAASSDHVVLTLRDSEIYLAHELLFATPTGSIPLDPKPLGEVNSRRPRRIDMAGKAEFYLESIASPGISARYLKPDGTTSPLAVTPGQNVRVFQLSAQRGAVTFGGSTLLARALDPASPGAVLPSELVDEPTAYPLRHVVGAGSHLVGSIIEANNRFDFLECDTSTERLVDCTAAINLQPAGIGPTGTTLEMAGSSLGAFALVEGGSTRALVHLALDGIPGLLGTRSVDSTAAHLAAGPTHVCFAGGDSGSAHVYCAGSMTEGDPLVDVYDVGVRDIVLSADATYLYTAYRCSGTLDIHVQRLPWSEALAGGLAAECPPP